MNAFLDSLIELIRRPSAEIPGDVQKAILDSLEKEKKGTIAESAMKIIDRNIALAKQKSQPICRTRGASCFMSMARSAWTRLRSRMPVAWRSKRRRRKATCDRIRWTR